MIFRSKNIFFFTPQKQIKAMNLLAINQLNSSLRHIIVPFTIFDLFQMYYDLDTELSYQCDPGYKRKGFQVAQCFFYNGTARWFGPDLKCHPIDCGAPEEILNGKRAGDCTTYRCQVLPMYIMSDTMKPKLFGIQI